MSMIDLKELWSIVSTDQFNKQVVPTIRCFHCNKVLSPLYPKLYVPQLKLQQFFKENHIERYCCKMCLLQDYLAYEDFCQKVTTRKTQIQSQESLQS